MISHLSTFFLYAQTQPAGAPAQQAPGSFFASMLPMLIAFFAIMYFLTIRPQQKREKERREMLSALTKGDRVITSGGICGDVVGLTDSHVVLRVDDDVKIEFVRAAVSQVLPRESKESR